MITKLTHVTLWVPDQDEAKKYYTETLGFVVATDDSTTMPGYRWLSVKPAQQSDLEIVLAKAVQPEEIAAVGKQTTWVLASDNIQDDYRRLKAAGVKVASEPQANPYGTDFVFTDYLGNSYDLVQTPSR